jgi:hypothetical protein
MKDPMSTSQKILINVSQVVLKILRNKYKE